MPDHRPCSLPPTKYEGENYILFGVGCRCSYLAVAFHAVVSRKSIAHGHMATDAVLFREMHLLPALSLSNTLWVSEACVWQFRQQWILLDELASV